jgi:hypothetical protein
LFRFFFFFQYFESPEVSHENKIHPRQYVDGSPPRQVEALPRDLAYIRRSLLDSTTPKRLFDSFYSYDLNREGKLDESLLINNFCVKFCFLASFLHVLSRNGIYVDKSMAKSIVNVAGEKRSSSLPPPEERVTPKNRPADIPEATTPQTRSVILSLKPEVTSSPSTSAQSVPQEPLFVGKAAKTPDPRRYIDNIPLNLGMYMYGSDTPYRPQRVLTYLNSLQDNRVEVKKKEKEDKG